ncbi:protein of unknown function (DUF4345) [Streptoalloteichus tenebrarius]|uniref:DUF4345 domain-containing protein n=1 Tax=Streptoalloteichus tenebrarius (strain ATCC 17920 / DSM 40477 / JCM 4838 / CBS 697.72 / NBRC 16177 / NCIMB 11028 / NRRL B-12390 / A12253. 1 / ISP 5477) TaxID=1933 RepID=A0ABT1I1M7_STRSD|nr:DUF4345 domain-containing protein [Streptoalloteichus tenebrarius]MCP2261485.1 protein of unknown function (DUF4345) [Streptoalloteichus tenebrarius]BFE99358.1 hypothetical protein GCM10020241_10340 [Streptoalloteichus tenebrarius]
MASRRALQVVLVLLGLFVVGSGAADIALGPAVLPGSPEVVVNVDNHYRFFASIWLSLGVVLLWTVPRVESATGPVRGVCAAVFLGGLARLVSVAAVGVPHALLVAFIGIELVIPPVLVLWQNQVVRSTARAAAARHLAARAS